MRLTKHLTSILKLASLLCYMTAAKCPALPAASHYRTTAQPSLAKEMRWAHKKKPIVALVLSGGASRGIAHVATLKALEEAGIVPDFIVGCSAGAIVGAAYADRCDIDHTQEIARTLVTPPKNYSFFVAPSLRKAMNGQGIFGMSALRRYLQKELHAKTFEELTIPLVVVTTNLHTEAQAIHYKGELVNPVCASSAIPGIFRPVCIASEMHTDGGVISEMPVMVARTLGADIVIAVNITLNGQSHSARFTRGSVVGQAFSISRQHTHHKEIEEADIVISPDFNERYYLLITQAQARDIYRAGKKAAQEAVPAILALIKKHKQRSWKPW